MCTDPIHAHAVFDLLTIKFEENDPWPKASLLGPINIVIIHATLKHTCKQSFHEHYITFRTLTKKGFDGQRAHIIILCINV